MKMEVVYMFNIFLLFLSMECTQSKMLTHGTIKTAKIVDAINNKKDHPWKASTYNYNEIDIREFRESRLGVKMTGKPPKLSASEDKTTDFSVGLLHDIYNIHEKRLAATGEQAKEPLPGNFTWANATKSKTHGCHSKVRDQANCGSCWAVSSVSAFSDRLCISTKGKMNTPLSSNLVVGCNKKNYGCNGGYMYLLYDFLRDNGTITGGEYNSDEGCQPYSLRPCGFPHELPCTTGTSLDPKCLNGTCTNDWYSKKKEKHFYRIDSYYGLYGIEAAMRDIYENGPITATFYVYADFLTYKEGVYVHTLGWWPIGGHAVKVVGWGEEKGVKYWHVSNSWGEAWGEKGHFKIIRGINNCGFESMLQGVKLKKH